MQGKKQIELSPEDVQRLLDRVAERSLEETDYQTLQGMIETLLLLKQAHEEKRITVRKLLRLLFGAPTEKARNVFGDLFEENGKGAGTRARDRKKSKNKPKGHGRNGRADYPEDPGRTPEPACRRPVSGMPEREGLQECKAGGAPALPGLRAGTGQGV